MPPPLALPAPVLQFKPPPSSERVRSASTSPGSVSGAHTPSRHVPERQAPFEPQALPSATPHAPSTSHTLLAHSSSASQGAPFGFFVAHDPASQCSFVAQSASSRHWTGGGGVVAQSPIDVSCEVQDWPLGQALPPRPRQPATQLPPSQTRPLVAAPHSVSEVQAAHVFEAAQRPERQSSLPVHASSRGSPHRASVKHNPERQTVAAFAVVHGPVPLP